MYGWAWFAAGGAVLVAVLALSLALNRRKTAAYLALRLADVARARGQHAVALALYDHALHLGQKPPELLEGRERAQRGDGRPALPPPVVAATEQQWQRAGDSMRRVLARSGYAGPWPEPPDEKPGHQNP